MCLRKVQLDCEKWDSIGFTGTRLGMTPYQEGQVRDYLIRHNVKEGHHGDCIGADAQFHNICVDLGIRTVVYPPTNAKYRAFCKADEVRDEKPYIKRNMDIVNESDFMIATPFQLREVQRSGTWSTIRYSKKVCKYIYVITPEDE